MTTYNDYGDALVGGRWVRDGLILRWVSAITAREARMIACPTCLATVTESCRTVDGQYTKHRGRLIARRCICGNPLRGERRYCTAECQASWAEYARPRREQAAA